MTKLLSFVLTLLCAGAIVARGEVRNVFKANEKLELSVSVCTDDPAFGPDKCQMLGTLNATYSLDGLSAPATISGEVRMPKGAVKGTASLWMRCLIRSRETGISFFQSKELLELRDKPRPLRYLLTDPKPDWVRGQKGLFLKPKAAFHYMAEPLSFPEGQAPDVLPVVSGAYKPPLFLSFLSSDEEDLIPVFTTTTTIPLTVTVKPEPLSRVLWLMQISASLRQQVKFGFTEKDIDQIKGLFLDTEMWVLYAVGIISFLHLAFDLLALKNDIAFWRAQKADLEGVSVRTVAMNAALRFVVFLYLVDNNASYLILVSMALALLVDAWKISKGFRITFSSGIPRLEARAAYSQTTSEYDSKAQNFLIKFLAPLVLCYSIYALVYIKQAGWYSWVLTSLTSSAYAIGFALMTPQLFINYKLKSVAHIPWRALTYRALNTFTDDIFAFIIAMPTMHRLSCFRDDIIFFIYLYQRWIYRTDASRTTDLTADQQDSDKKDK